MLQTSDIRSSSPISNKSFLILSTLLKIQLGIKKKKPELSNCFSKIPRILIFNAIKFYFYQNKYTKNLKTLFDWCSLGSKTPISVDVLVSGKLLRVQLLLPDITYLQIWFPWDIKEYTKSMGLIISITAEELIQSFFQFIFC